MTPAPNPQEQLHVILDGLALLREEAKRFTLNEANRLAPWNGYELSFLDSDDETAKPCQAVYLAAIDAADLHITRKLDTGRTL